MFRTAATKLAHNSTIPALAGNSDLKPLQEVIASEKLVLQSLQRLSTDFGKSSEALLTWAKGEGEDLGDTFSACTTLLEHWISSLASFASHITYIRECLKAVRTREEALDEMHRRRKSLMSKADSADRKLNKMSPENKNLRQQTDLLMSLREQIRTLDVEIMNEEASIGDWKRTKAREWMGVLFGGLLECSEKGAVVATFGRTIIGYVSTEKTQPGLPRAHYSDHSKVEPLVLEAERELHKISFISQVGDGALQTPDEYRIGDIPGLPPPSPSSPVRSTPTHPPRPYALSTLPNNPPSNPHELSDFGEYNPYSQSQTYTPGQRTQLSSLDQPPPMSPIRPSPLVSLSPQGGSGFTPGHQPHLSQNSIHSGSGFTPNYPPPTVPVLHPVHPPNHSGFTPEHKPSTDDTFLSSVAKALGDNWEVDENGGRKPPRLSVDGPPPSYATNTFSTSTPPNPPRPPYLVERKPVPTHIPETSDEDDDGVGLSYLNPTNDDSPSQHSDGKRLSDGGSGFQEDRKVRWGSVRDVDMELEKRYAEETRKSNEMRRSVSPAQYPKTPSPAYHSRTPSPPMPEPHPHIHQHTSVQPTESPTSIHESQPLPNPNVSVEDEGPSQPDERSLNALAAREISKQMEMSSSPLSPPSLPFAGRRSVSPRPTFTSEIPSYTVGTGLVTSPSPPPPPPPPPHFTNLTLTRQLTSSPNLSQPPPPPAAALPHPSSMESDLTQPDDAYRTPPEYLRNSSTPPSPAITSASPLPVRQMTPTLSPSPSTQTAIKKISAAAFRRPGMRGPVNARDDALRQDSLGVGFRPSPSPSRERGGDESGDGGPDAIVTPLTLRKKSLPAVPGISTKLLSGPRGSGASRSISSPFPSLKTDEEQPLGPGRTFPLSGSPGSRPRESILGGGDEDFDYVSAYMNEDEGKQNGTPNGMTNDHGGGPGTSLPQNEGYGSGRFATTLED